MRAVSSRALGAIVKGMGEDCYNDLMPWLLETLTSEVSSVDRSGAAQGMANSTYLLSTSSSSCIDLIFTFQSNLVMESGFQPSFHPNCHYQVVFAKFDLSIYYPPPYEKIVWYNRANAGLIRRAIDLFGWDKALRINDVDK